MKKSLSDWQFWGFVFTGALGALLHFLYDWTGNNAIIGSFSAVNESIWEHMKLMFFPMLIFAVIESRFLGKEYENFWCVKLVGIILGTVLIPVLFYTIGGAFGKTPDFVNIIIFYLSAYIAYMVETRLLEKGVFACKHKKMAIIILYLLAVVFVIFTFYPPQIPLFLDPVSGSYGI